jgi:hypothetical protein
MSIDNTARLPIVKAAPRAVTAEPEEAEAEALVAELADRLAGVRVLAPSRGDRDARAALREELARMVATAQQLAAHLTVVEQAARDAETDPQFQDWLNAPGGRR